MFNMDMMKQGAEAFGKVAEGIERMTDVAHAYALRDMLKCPHAGCPGIAGHPDPATVHASIDSALASMHEDVDRTIDMLDVGCPKCGATYTRGEDHACP